MSIWAQIADDRVTTVPPDGKTITSIYAEFEFSGDPLPEGTIVKFLIGKGAPKDNSLADEQELKALVKPIKGIELFDNEGRVESLFVRDESGGLVAKNVAKALVKPIAQGATDNFSVVAYSTFDKIGTVKRLAFKSVTLIVSSGEGTFVSSIEQYDPLADSWSIKSSMPTGRSGISCSTINNKIYAIGGFDGNFTGVNEEYDPTTDTWSTKTAMDEGRGFSATVAYANEIYVIGGYNFSPGRASTTVDKYDPGSDTWTSLSSLPIPLAFHAAQLFGSEIWVFYGATKFSDDNKLLNTNSSVFKYDITFDTWSTEDAIFAGATSTVLNQSVAVGDQFLVIPNGAALPSIGAVTLDRGNASQETLNYSSFQDGRLVLLSPATNIHSSGATVDQASLPRIRLAPNYYDDGVDLIKIFNGSKGEGNVPSDVFEEFSVSTNTSSVPGSPPVSALPRSRAGQALLSNELCIVGGSAEKSDFLDELEKVNVLTDVFTGPSGLGQMNMVRTFCGSAVATISGNDYLYAIGGQGSGHEPGWLRMDTSAQPSDIRADGREQSSLFIKAVDASGDPVPDDVKIKARGLIYIPQEKIDEDRTLAQKTSAAADRQPTPTISILPVLFSAKEIFTSGGQASTVLLDRSEDPLNEVENLFKFAKDNEEIISESELKKKADHFANFDQQAGERRDLYKVSVEMIVDDPFWFGQTDTGATVAEEQPPGISTEFSFNPPSLKQGQSASVGFYSDVASIPDVQRVTSEPIGSVEVIVELDKIAEEIPFGASPHYDAMVAGASQRNVEPPALPLLPPTNLMVSTSDNEESGSASSPQDVADEANLVAGIRKFPIFVTNFVITDPISLAARKERTDVSDLEVISSETGGNSFSVDDPSYISFVIDRIKVSAPSSIGSGSISKNVEISGPLSAVSYAVSNLISGNSASMTVRYSNDGYNFVQLATNIPPNSVFSFGSPVQAEIVEYEIRLSSKTLDSPILTSVEIQYIKPSVQYLFTYQQIVGGQVTELAAVTNQRVPDGCKIEAGLSHGASHEFDRDFVSDSQPTVSDRGTIHAINRSFDTIIDGTIFRDVMTSSDFVIYRSKSGPWAQDAIARIFVNEFEVLPTAFVATPEEGAIVFKEKLSAADRVTIEVQNPSTFRVGLKITNPTIQSGVLDSFAFMFSESETVSGFKANRPPRATNVFVSPSPATPGGPLVANYTFSDPDGDDEDKDETEINWFRNGVPVTELKNKRSFTNLDLVARRGTLQENSMIVRGQEWFFTVRPSDGKSFGPVAVSNKVIIANVPPSATQATLVSSNTADPLEFTSSDNITVDLKTTDADGDEIAGSIYTWFVNGIEFKSGTESELGSDEEDDAGNKILKPGVTVRADVIPYDGRDFGTSISTNTITVLSSPPVVTDVSVLPTTPSPASMLRVSYKFVDVDKERDQSRIAWFKDDAQVSVLNDLKEVAAGNLKPGQRWYATVTPFDGVSEGTPVKSNVVLVQF